MTPISTEQLHAFYNSERVVFHHLITKIARNPAQSLLVMALWIWLEKIGYPSVIPVVVHLYDPVINAMFNEADTCLKCLQLKDFSIPRGGGLPLTTIAMQMDISLEFFVWRRFTAIAGIKSVLNNICARIFTDILQMKFGSTNIRINTRSNISASARRGTGICARATTSISARRSTSARSRACASTNASTGTSTTLPTFVTPLVVPGFPHRLFGNFTTPPINFEEIDLSNPRIWGNTEPHDDIPDDDKTMFLTFSKGFPVMEEEVRHLFTSCYGECIKVLNMREMRKGGLFAIMVLNKVEQLDIILDGKFIAKLRVNGKHVWARKYERRD